jgi:Mg2+-importing ATPase
VSAADAAPRTGGEGPPGLSSAEAARRLAEAGPNEPVPRSRAGFGEQARAQLANPLVLILLAASGVSFAVGQWLNASIIAGIVILGLALNLLQTYRSGRATEALRESVASRASVHRDGRWAEILRREVVPGDLVRLSAGDLVPADADLLEARDLHVQEASLTGESLPVEKEAGSPREGRSRVFLGTSVVSGAATAVVTATGAATRFGQTASRVAERPPRTAFETGERAFGVLMMRVVLFLVLFVLLVNLILRRDALESLLFAVALAVGLTPEFLPMIVTVTLANGAVRMARRKVVVKRLAAMQNFGSMNVLCSDKTGTLTRGEMTLTASVDAAGRGDDEVRAFGRLVSRFQTGIRSPFDAAILAGPDPGAGSWTKRDEVPFDFERRRLSVVLESAGNCILITQGAPEAVLPGCATVWARGAARPLDADARSHAGQVVRRFGEGGARVLAVATRAVAPRGSYGADDERDLTLRGFLAFDDPPRSDAAELLQGLRRDGVTVKILTGDSAVVAGHVCAQVGLAGPAVVEGEELERTTDGALEALAERAAIFARLSPGQKTRIVRALQRRGHVVGFLGDGINDAPSLRAADVGISVAGGAEVAREAAEIILLEKGLRVLHRGILEGRRAVANVTKYLLMGTSSNFGNVLSMAGASLLLPFLPMLPTQILLNNFLYDLAQVAIPADHVDPAALRRPRRWDIGLVRRFMVRVGPVSSLFDLLTFVVLLRLFRADETLFHTGWFVESLATQTLVIFVIRTRGRPWRSAPASPLVAAALGAVAAGVLIPYTPLAPALGFRPLPVRYLAFLLVVTAGYLASVEALKRRLAGWQA